MAILSKDALLGASDLVERVVDLPIGQVKVRSLSGAYSNQAMSDSLEVNTGRRGEQTARVNTQKLEALQVLHGMIEPKLDSVDEVNVFAQHCGPSWRMVIEAIDEISGVNKEAIEKANQTFPVRGQGEGGNDMVSGDSGGNGTGRSDLPARARA